MLMPAFHDWPAEAAIIARLLAGYGELEFQLAISAGTALTDFVSMEKAVRAEEKVEYEWQAATLHRLQEFERYFEYNSACLMHVDQELWDKNGGPQSQAFPMPAHRNPPLERVPASPAAVALLPKEF
jgi:hypothetical protein